MSGTINIQPTTVTEVKTITNFRVSLHSLELFKSVTLQVVLFGDQNNQISTEYVTLSGDDYAGWDNDDSYIINKVAEKLNLTIKN